MDVYQNESEDEGLTEQPDAIEGLHIAVPLTGQQAAQLLGATARMAQRRAREAAERGDRRVLRIGAAWVASEKWWRKHLVAKPMGRPRKVKPEDHQAPS